jgi:hypothetical protein
MLDIVVFWFISFLYKNRDPKELTALCKKYDINVEYASTDDFGDDVFKMHSSYKSAAYKEHRSFFSHDVVHESDFNAALEHENRRLSECPFWEQPTSSRFNYISKPSTDDICCNVFLDDSDRLESSLPKGPKLVRSSRAADANGYHLKAGSLANLHDPQSAERTGGVSEPLILDDQPCITINSPLLSVPSDPVSGIRSDSSELFAAPNVPTEPDKLVAVKLLKDLVVDADVRPFGQAANTEAGRKRTNFDCVDLTLSDESDDESFESVREEKAPSMAESGSPMKELIFRETVDVDVPDPSNMFNGGNGGVSEKPVRPSVMVMDAHAKLENAPYSRLKGLSPISNDGSASPFDLRSDSSDDTCADSDSDFENPPKMRKSLGQNRAKCIAAKTFASNSKSSMIIEDSDDDDGILTSKRKRELAVAKCAEDSTTQFASEHFENEKC